MDHTPGGILFAISADGRTFAGRYDSGECWNGRGVADGETPRSAFSSERTTSYMDEIMTSLATGFVKLGIVVAGIVVGAEIVDLPYEGVITGLGIGGVALAFASRETVSNMLGGALLMTDRPFKRGDLV